MTRPGREWGERGRGRKGGWGGGARGGGAGRGGAVPLASALEELGHRGG